MARNALLEEMEHAAALGAISVERLLRIECGDVPGDAELAEIRQAMRRETGISHGHDFARLDRLRRGTDEGI